ncbi:hypothetical protein ABB37_05332 [Leptomonas pyrrhocoris]|uniref:Uncharacterized protein n=1 Tax=Leptomonas pyrrhocoris TaxID=157538 RepID=A0A0N1J4Q9_LEPPY|nr:hypothetical protein ABB37_05332 [Leptomonas pyrrhocoris]KPA79508.1 hypothetical protein ABB37_05332 [Leptomonas pyrrhocoris]|eukprot:XP_015657947.1 hypothetical protein ABB37_05332 [Leptomonas pyrrhocoris]
MNTAVFELLGKLAAGASSGQPNASPPYLPLTPLQTSLPTEEDCVLHGREKPILFFYDPRGRAVAAAAATTTRVHTAVTAAAGAPWLAELAAAQLASPTTAVQSLCVTAAEDDVESRLPGVEVWAEWPQTVRGWQLCPMSQLCAVVRGRPTAAAAATGPTLFFLLASRYELVGTQAIYERYLLLAPPHPSKGDAAGVAAAGATSINVRDLRTLRRVACLCRCFCTNGCEVQPRAAAAAAAAGLQSRTAASPPSPPTDFFLRLVPTSLQYTFCFTATALLSVAEEERSLGWAMATAKLNQPQHQHQHCKAGCRHRSCSTEAVNTSGALSDGGRTVYQDSSFSRERSTSAVRVVDGATMLGYGEDPRSATSTPSPPLAAGRLDEQQQGGSLVGGSADTRRAGDLESRLPQSQRWRALLLLRVVDTAYYNDQVPAGWRRWRYASSGILCRPLVVDSLDGIVRYIHGSRLAFYTAVAFLDRFIATTVDPIANFTAYRRQIYRARTGQDMDFSMMAGSGVGGPGSSDLLDGSAVHRGSGRGLAMEQRSSRQPPYGDDDEVQARDICGFLTQVIVVCIMLGSKTVDLYPPRIRQLMGCVEDTAPISEQEFVILELHVLQTLAFPVHPVTLFESVNALLALSTSDKLFATLTASHTTRRLLEEHQDRGHLVDDVEKLLMEQEEKDAAAAVRGSGHGALSQPSPPTAAVLAPGTAPSQRRSSHGYGGGHPSESLTHTSRQAINDWLRLRLFTYFVCDEVIRADAAGSSSASSSASGSRLDTPAPTRDARGEEQQHPQQHEVHSGDEDTDSSGDSCNVLQYSPVLVATAALVTAAEQVCMPLPAPLLRLLPPSVRERLREADAPTMMTTTDDTLRARRRYGCNEESNSMGRESPSPFKPTSGTAAAETLRLTAQPMDDSYKMLEELSMLLEAELVRLSAADGRRGPGLRGAGLMSPSRDVAEEQDVGDEEDATPAALASSSAAGTLRSKREGLTGNALGGAPQKAAARRSAIVSALPCVDPCAMELLGRVIRQVKIIHERSRESCPPVLLQRYQSLFREAA